MVAAAENSIRGHDNKAMNASASEGDAEFGMDVLDTEHKSTRQDAANMRRLGRSQELVRHFRLLSMVSFVALATAAWELAIFAISPALVDGGRPNLIYSSIWCFLGFGPIYLSMAEMASMAPIAGAQFNWVSEFAPESIQKTLSYFTGWISTLAWQAGNAWGLILIGTLFQSIIMVNFPDYEAPSWHGTLIVIGFTGVALCANIFGAKLLPYWQNAIFALHVLAYVGFIIPIWINGPRASSRDVWLNFENSGGWSSMGLSVLIGQLPGMACQVGIDAAAHMSEEVRNAATAVPIVMMATWAINYITIFIAILTIAYHMPDVPAALADSTEYPVIYVLRETMSLPWLNVILSVILVLLLLGNLSYLAGVTRDIFAFARDQGLPFSSWIAKVDKKRNIPTNACVLSGTITALLSLIYIGSPVAFYAVTSLCTVALLSCYCISIGCVLWRRIYLPDTLPPSSFSLGSWGIAANVFGVFFSAWSAFWCLWPQDCPVTAAGFNWASPIFVAVVIIAAAWYIIGGKKQYHGSVVLVEGRKVRMD